MRDELGINIADIKAKITNLRSQLGREVSKTKSKKSGQSVSENYKSTWMYWDRLQFLMPVMQAGKSKDSLSSRSSTPESLDIDDCLDDSTYVVEVSLLASSSDPRSSFSSTSFAIIALIYNFTYQ